MFLERSDVGKSRRIHELVGRVTARGGSAAVLDADLGQSTYGLPTTLNLVRFAVDAGQPTPEVKLLRFGSVAVEAQGKERIFSPREW